MKKGKLLVGMFLLLLMAGCSATGTSKNDEGTKETVKTSTVSTSEENSVNKGEKIPPSLRNIYIELNSDLGIIPAKHGDLTAWVEQGVFLLNATLTVEQAKPNSHKDIGWQIFTDRVIEIISNFDYPKVFILWGSFAISKSSLIKSNENNFIITSPHPSPFSAHRGFFGSKPFSKANNFLISRGVKPIDWRV